MTDLTALIERVESGAGSDRQLEIAICCTILDAKAHKGWWNFQALRPRGEPEKPASEFWKRFSPAYTTSLDAVLSLIEAKLPGRARDLLQEALDDMGTRGWDSKTAELPQIVRAALSAALRAIQETRADDR